MCTEQPPQDTTPAYKQQRVIKIALLDKLKKEKLETVWHPVVISNSNSNM
jgi:hypothetical protein